MLFDKLVHSEFGTLKNRFVMSPMTRDFAEPSGCANEAIHRYYEKRARLGAGLIVTEGIVVDRSANGYKRPPFLYEKAHAESWSPIVSAVHAHDTKIFAQIWHCGRFSHEDFTGGIQPISSSALAAGGTNRQNAKPYATPRPMQADDFQRVSDQVLNACKLAIQAGFDGVQLHYGHGYLFDSFLDGNVNTRSDAYGGTVENRCRFPLDVAKRVIDELGQSRVCVRISPIREIPTRYQWTELEETLDYLIPAFDKIGLRFLDMSCARADYFQTSGHCVGLIRSKWPHLLMAGASLSREQADQELTTGRLDLVTWGRNFIANPDFVEKWAQNKPLTDFSPAMLSSLD